MYQLKIAKDTARLNAQRDSLLLSASQCDSYLHNIIPLLNALDAAIKEKGITFFEKAEVDIRGDSIRIRPNLENDGLITEMNKLKTIVRETLEAFNAMEAFALFFVSGVADETVAFSFVGKTYCNSVGKYLPWVVTLSQDGGYYRSMIKLHLIWHARSERHKLLKDRNRIEEQLNSVRDKFIKPVGTD